MPETKENATAGPIVALLNTLPDDLGAAGFQVNDLLVSINNHGLGDNVEDTLKEIGWAKGRYPFFGFRPHQNEMQKVELEVELTDSKLSLTDWATPVWLMSNVTESYSQSGLQRHDFIMGIVGFDEAGQNFTSRITPSGLRRVHNAQSWLARGIRLDWTNGKPEREEFLATISVQSYR